MPPVPPRAARTTHGESIRAGTLVRLLVACALVAAIGCAKRDVEWGEDRRTAGVMLPGSTLVLLEGGVPAVRAAWTPVRWPEDSVACDGTRVGTRARGDTAFAFWWTRPKTGGARLVAARSDDGGINWLAADTVGLAEAAADPRDPCRRPAAALAVDAATGAILTVYHGQSGGHDGILLARYRGAAPPTLIAEGAGFGMAAVASAGDTVAVAFASPSADDARIWLAISSVSGHIPGIPVTVSRAGIRAFAPAVAVRDGRVAVAWNEARSADAGPGAVARVGRIAR